MRQRATPLGPDHTEAMRIVDHQPGVMNLGQRQQLVQRRQITVHAEDRIGDDQLDCRIAGSQQRFELHHVTVGKTLYCGLGQLHAVDQRGMVQLLGKDHGAGVAQGAQHGQIGHIAGAKKQRLRVRNIRPDPASQSLFKLIVCQ